MRNYFILFAILLIVCVYSLCGFGGKSYPEVVSVMAKSGIVISVIGMLFTGLSKDGSNGMSIE